MAAAKQEGQPLTGAERGRQALDFIASTRVCLNATPEFVSKVLDDLWNRNIQTTPRHYGVTFQRGLYMYHVNPFVSHIEPLPDEGRAVLQVKKYPANSEPNQDALGGIFVSSAWGFTEDGEKLFKGGSALYYGQDISYPGTEDFALALKKGKELTADMMMPIRF